MREISEFQTDPSSQVGNTDHLKVVAIVVTYQRPAVLARTLESVRAQSRSPNHVLVIDNDPEESARSLAAEFACVYVSTGSNHGYGYGISVGMENAQTADWYWVLDDDSTPSRNSLQILLEQTGPTVGVIANRGGQIRFGLIRHNLSKQPLGTVRQADFTLIDGSLVNAVAVRNVGPVRGDLFLMLEDFEFTSRVSQFGYRLLVVGGDRSVHDHLGTTSPWRGYYQSRNHLRICLDRKSLSLMFGWLAREVVIALNLIARRDAERLRWRIRGTWDGLSNRMGRRHDL